VNSENEGNAEINVRESGKVWVLVALYLACTLFYYLGEIIDLAGWDALSWDFLYGVHDVHRLLFLAPIMYAAYCFGLRACIIVLLVVFNTFIPRALFISMFPNALLRTLLFMAIAGALGCHTAILVTRSKNYRRFCTLVRKENQGLRQMLDFMEEGAVIIGPDHKIRYMNGCMAKDFGNGIGSSCDEYFRKCGIPDEHIFTANTGAGRPAERREYTVSDGRVYEVLVSPLVDESGAVCRLAMFREITP